MKKLDAFKEKMSMECVVKNKEIYLTGLSLFLLGLVLGIFLSPKKYSVIGSNNGNYNGNGSQFDTNDEDSEEEGK